MILFDLKTDLLATVLASNIHEDPWCSLYLALNFFPFLCFTWLSIDQIELRTELTLNLND